MYCTFTEVDMVLAQALTTAKPNTTSTVKLINIGNDRNLNVVTDDIVKQYIIYADSQINGILSQQYYVPLKKCIVGIYYNINLTSTTGKTVVFESTHDLFADDEIIIRNEAAGLSGVYIVASVVNTTTITTTEDIDTALLITDTYAAKSAYPHPINQIASRLAASYIYDKYFAAQVDPNNSNYGKEMRAVAMGQLNDILNGKTVLKNQQRIGDLFGNPWIDDTYAVRDRGFNTSERNMSKIT